MRKKITKAKRSLVGSAIGVVATLLMHGYFVLAVAFGGDRSESPKKNEQYGYIGDPSLDEFSSVLILIDSDAIGEAGPRSISAPFPALAKEYDFLTAQVPVELPVPHVDPTSFEVSEQELGSESSEPDAAAMAAMFGNYTGQVMARIERAWMRPAPTPDSRAFVCQIRVEQDRNGNVLSVELMDCDNDSQWQMSLVAAVERASPLSLPPDPSVFSKELVLKFSSADPAEFAAGTRRTGSAL